MKPASSIRNWSKPARVSEARINISNLRLRTFIGFNPEEKAKQQDVIVNAEIRYRADAAFVSDDEADALNAFVHKTPEIAMERAKAADERIKGGDAPSMCGLPIGIKDLFCTKGVPSQAASGILEGFKPEYESTVSQQLAEGSESFPFAKRSRQRCRAYQRGRRWPVHGCVR